MTATKRVFFHVGAPKTGTTYLQLVLLRNREALARNGVLYPYERHDESFRSTIDFRGIGWAGMPPGEHAGAWDRVAARCRDWPGDTVIVSNELLGGATRERIEHGLGTVRPADVHVVFTARDFARQLVSDWQEHIKHRHQVPLETFVDDLVEKGIDAPEPFGEMFWGLHDAARVLGTWAEVVPPENIHLVTVPHAGGPRDVLWRRFCAVTGLDPDAYDPEGGRSNSSMGVVETELVRRINAEVMDLPNDSYDHLVRIQLAEHILGKHSPGLSLPPQHREWARKRSRELIDELSVAGYRVEGDLEELMPADQPGGEYVSPTELTEADLAPAAIRAATGLLRHSSDQRGRIGHLRGRLDAATAPRSSRDLAMELYRRARGRAGRALRRVRSR
ncbi:hypothetical protein [Prauserella shujinwangii]|uniref:hypothetical protein n=1 Tax=Prauserella shujinwangii TaxID=1453103 RepID=UPI000D07E833|nr:hypothetical protein [Prauserella shujinwangii]